MIRIKRARSNREGDGLREINALRMAIQVRELRDKEKHLIAAQVALPDPDPEAATEAEERRARVAQRLDALESLKRLVLDDVERADLGYAARSVWREALEAIDVSDLAAAWQLTAIMEQVRAVRSARALDRDDYTPVLNRLGIDRLGTLRAGW